MAFDSFGDFLRALDKAGELIRISQPVATELEITEIADREMKKPGGGKALLFEKPTVNGQISPFPLAINTMGSNRRMAMSLGASSVDAAAAELGSLMKAKPPTGFKEAIQLLGTALDLRHAKPKLVKSGPCKEVIHRFEATPTQTQPWPKAPQIVGPEIVEPLTRSNVQSELNGPRAISDSTVQRFNGSMVQSLNAPDCSNAWNNAVVSVQDNGAWAS